MAIHREAALAHFDDHTDQVVIARLFDEAFDITYGAEDGGGLSYWLASPTQNATERFGFQREIIVIYSPFTSSDARIVTMFERLLTMDAFRDRADPSVGLIVHNGNPDALATILETVQDTVLVPLLARDIRANTGTGFIRKSIAESLGQVDPFAVSSPITVERNFFGRRDITQTLYAALRSGLNAGLFGLRKTGKTSVLFAVMRRLDDERLAAVHIDCQSPGVHHGRWWQLLERVTEDFAEKLRTSFKRNAKVQLGYTEKDAADRFRADIHTLLIDGAVERFVALFDEIEHITPEIASKLGSHWDHDFLPFWQTVRAVHQETQGRLAFVVAGVNPAAVERSHFLNQLNPIFEVAAPRFLEPFGSDAVRELVRTVGRYGGVRFSPEAIAHIDKAYGGHPYLIRLACSEVWQRSPHSDEALTLIDRGFFLANDEAISGRLMPPIRDILLSLAWWYPDDYDMLQMIAETDENAEFVREYLSASPSDHAEYTKLNLLDPASGEFRIDAIGRFLRDHGKEYREALSPFASSDVELDLLPEIVDVKGIAELFAKRTEVESRLRRVIMQFLGVHHTFDKQRISSAIIKALRKSHGRQDPAQLFVGREPKDAIQELYFADLTQVVVANWQIFANLFENKARFRMNMDTANRARRVDAHAKSISAAEHEEFLNSFQWLLGRLRKVPD